MYKNSFFTQLNVKLHGTIVNICTVSENLWNIKMVLLLMTGAEWVGGRELIRLLEELEFRIKMIKEYCIKW